MPPVTTSPLADALNRVGDRWTLLAVAALLDGPRRFNELQESLGQIAPNILSARLKALGEHGLVVSRPYQQRPVRVVYELTEAGHELAGALRLLADWGAREGDGEPLRHDACGTSLRAVWWCDTCGEPVTPGDEHLDFV